MEFKLTFTLETAPSQKNNLISLTSFARVAEMISSPTYQHKMTIDRLKDIDTVKDNYNDGTAIGYAIYKTSLIIKAAEERSTIILITDGLQSPGPLRTQGRPPGCPANPS